MDRRTVLRSTLAALTLSVLALNPSFGADNSKLFSYVEEGHEPVAMQSMERDQVKQLTIDFKYTREAQVVPQDTAYALIQSRGAVVIDVREPDEYAAGHLVGAYNIPKDSLLHNQEFEAAIKASKTPVMVYCRSGVRADEAMKMLEDAGYKYVMSIGGVKTWPYGLTTEPTTKPIEQAAAEVKMPWNR